MKYEPKIKVVVWSKDGVYGSMLHDEKYDEDTLAETIEFLQWLMEKIPPAFKSSARFRIDSVGGYEGEHHAEVEVYYERPETDDERSERKRREDAEQRAAERRERETLAALKRKYEA